MSYLDTIGYSKEKVNIDSAFCKKKIYRTSWSNKFKQTEQTVPVSTPPILTLPEVVTNPQKLDAITVDFMLKHSILKPKEEKEEIDNANEDKMCKQFLINGGLGKFIIIFRENCYLYDINEWVDIEDDELKELGLKALHIKRFKKKLEIYIKNKEANMSKDKISEPDQQ